MVRIPVKFKWVDEVGRVNRSCDESSGSEHSADLSGLVNSFLEREIGEQRTSDNQEFDLYDIDHDGSEIISINQESDQSNSEFQDSLKKLFDGDHNDSVKRSIRAEVELAADEFSSAAADFKRRLMARLRDRGFDAGLCKSKWEKNGRNPSGDYEYIDVNSGGTRYTVEVFLAGEFTIARPTTRYASLLKIFPTIFVGKPDELKQVVKIMSKAIRKSMKSVDLNVPPWRRLAYMQAKWFGPYKRTTNEIPTLKPPYVGRNLAGERLVGFVTAAAPGVSSLYCRGDFGATSGRVRIGNLAAALK